MPRTRRGKDCVLKIGAIITSAPVRASTSVNTMNRLIRNPSSPGMYVVSERLATLESLVITTNSGYSKSARANTR